MLLRRLAASQQAKASGARCIRCLASTLAARQEGCCPVPLARPASVAPASAAAASATSTSSGTNSSSSSSSKPHHHHQQQHQHAKAGVKRRAPGAPPTAAAVNGSANAAAKASSPSPAAQAHAHAAGAGAAHGHAHTVVVHNSAKHKTQSFYRRQLPTDHCVAFSSAEGRRMFQEALQEGGLETYFPLSEQFKTQDDPAFCGLGALTMVLNALAIDPGRTWKGPWRWFDESMLECCEPLEVVRSRGICIGKLDCLARCNGATTVLKYGDSVALEEFREDIVRLTSTTPPPEELMIVGYNRKVLGQTGTGHFSPVGGYHRGRDMALIMDVARFKYPPHWVPVPQLWEAMQTVDPETGRSRGYLLVAKGMVSESLLFTIDKARYAEFADLALWLRDAAGRLLPPLMRDQVLVTTPTAAAAANPSVDDGGVDHSRLLPVFLRSLPTSVASMVTTYHDTLCLKYTERHLRSIDQLLAAIETHPTFAAMGAKENEAQLLRFRAGWGGGCCARSKAVTERHVLTIMYISVLEWLCQREGWPISRLFPRAVYSPPLQLEVGQLKRKFAAMADEADQPGGLLLPPTGAAASTADAAAGAAAAAAAAALSSSR